MGNKGVCIGHILCFYIYILFSKNCQRLCSELVELFAEWILFLYLIIVPLFEARGISFQILISTLILSCGTLTLLLKDDVLENKLSKTRNFEKNPVQNVHQGWKRCILAFLPRNKVLFWVSSCLQEWDSCFLSSWLFALQICH